MPPKTRSLNTRTESAAGLLRKLGRVRNRFDAEAAVAKRTLIRKLRQAELTSPRQIDEFHDALCFLWAYPDDEGVLREVERSLSRYGLRDDLVRLADKLRDTGIAGTEISYRFFWLTASWLAKRWPDQLVIDWEALEDPERLVEYLSLLIILSDTPAYDEVDFEPQEWIDMLRGAKETDATFLIRRFDRLPAADPVTEHVFEKLALPIKILPGKTTPSRTTAKLRSAPVHFQTRPLDTRRPDLHKALEQPPVSIEPVSTARGRELVNMAREAMVTRSRDLDSFMFADPRSVRMIDCGDGLRFAAFCYTPDRRLLLESVHSFLTMKNGVPTGYVLCSSLFESVEVAYNVFDTYRGGEAGAIYGRVLSMLRAVFHCNAFSVDPYQLGKENMEGLRSGAWWFYYKIGFRPTDATVKKVLRAELAKMKRRRSHRSSITTLEKLVQDSMHFYREKPRRDIIGRISLGDIGVRLMETVSKRFGSDREGAEETCGDEAAKMLGVRSRSGWSRDERLVWNRWGPLVRTLPGLTRWSAREKRDLVKVIRLKAAPYESDFVRAFDSHVKLRRAVLRLAGEPV